MSFATRTFDVRFSQLGDAERRVLSIWAQVAFTQMVPLAKNVIWNLLAEAQSEVVCLF